MKRYHWLLSVVVAALAACATTETQQTATPEAKEDKTTVTGSHIPTKKGTSSTVYSTNTQDAQDSLMHTGPAIQPLGGK